MKIILDTLIKLLKKKIRTLHKLTTIFYSRIILKMLMKLLLILSNNKKNTNKVII